MRPGQAKRIITGHVDHHRLSCVIPATRGWPGHLHPLTRVPCTCLLSYNRCACTQARKYFLQSQPSSTHTAEHEAREQAALLLMIWNSPGLIPAISSPKPATSQMFTVKRIPNVN